jgi:hypothetical protein
MIKGKDKGHRDWIKNSPLKIPVIFFGRPVLEFGIMVAHLRTKYLFL